MSERSELEELERQADELLAKSSLLLDESRRSFRNSDSPVSIQPRSANRKLARQDRVIANNGRIRNVPLAPYVVSTYVSIATTCPDSCVFKSGGCYAIAGATHLTMRGLNRAAMGMKPLDVTKTEAREIDRLWKSGIPQDGAKGGRDLRLHVGGEVSCREGARELAGAATRWIGRGGGRVWTFTHRWREIPRENWGPVSVLASCETTDDVREATRRGYAVAVTVPKYPDEQRSFGFGDRRAVPCPVEAGADTTCSQCRMCLDDDQLRRRGLAIAFAVHGSDEEEAAAHVSVARLKTRRHTR